MKHKSLLIIFISIFTFQLTAQKLQSPDEFLGYKLGSRFTRHHKVVLNTLLKTRVRCNSKNMERPTS